jgi:hypothetical protein
VLLGSIYDRYPRLDPFYRRVLLYGAGTLEPLAVIHVPEPDWTDLSGDQRDLLGSYVASHVDAVTAQPFAFSDIPEDAPAARLIRLNVARMSTTSWGILVGRLTDDGRDIYSDRMAVTGRG